MADNVTLNSGAGGDTCAADDIGGIKYQRVKVTYGVDGVATDASTTNPLPVQVNTDATGLGKVEDAAAASGDVGIAALTVRQDTPASSTSADGDYQNLKTDSVGRLHVNGSGVTQPVSDAGGTLTVDDGGSSLTVDGTVTATDGGGSLTVDNPALSVTGGGVEASALRVTIATDSTGVLSVDDNGGSLSIDDGGGSVTVDGSVSLAAAIPAGGNNIGDVDVVTLPGTYAEDAAHSNGELGMLALVVRRDADTTLVDTDGDRAPLQVNAAGSLKVAITAGAGSGGTSIADGASFTRNTTSITPAGAAVEASAPTLIDGDVAALSMTTAGALRIAVASGGIAGVVEDAASAGGEEGLMMLAVRRDSPSSGVSADGDFAALSVDSTGALRVAGGGGGTQFAEDIAHASGDIGTLALAVRRDSPVSGTSTDGDYASLNVNSSGRLYVSATIDAALPAGNNNIGDVDIASGPTGASALQMQGTAAADAAVVGNPILNGGRASTATPSAMSADGDSVSLWLDRSGATIVSGYVAQDAAVAGNPVLLGMRASTAVPTAMSADGDSVYAWADRNGAQIVAGRHVDDAAFTVGTDRVSAVGLMADEASTDSVDEGDVGIPRMTLDRKQVVTPYVHAAAGGQTPYKNLDCDETEDAVKASAGKLFWIHVINLSNAKRYLKFYDDTVANVSVGTTVPVLTFPIPTMGDTNGAGFTIHFGDHGVQFANAITVAATTGFADNDSGAPGTNEIILNAGYT